MYTVVLGSLIGCFFATVVYKLQYSGFKTQCYSTVLDSFTHLCIDFWLIYQKVLTWGCPEHFTKYSKFISLFSLSYLFPENVVKKTFWQLCPDNSAVTCPLQNFSAAPHLKFLKAAHAHPKVIGFVVPTTTTSHCIHVVGTYPKMKFTVQLSLIIGILWLGSLVFLTLTFSPVNDRGPANLPDLKQISENLNRVGYQTEELKRYTKELR